MNRVLPFNEKNSMNERAKGFVGPANYLKQHDLRVYHDPQ